MKYLEIVVMLLLIHVSASFVGALDIMEYSKNPNNEWLDDFTRSEWQNDSYIQSEVQSESDINFGFGDLIKGLYYFVKSFARGLIDLPHTLQMFGVPANISIILSFPLYIIYAIAIIQLLRGISTESMR